MRPDYLRLFGGFKKKNYYFNNFRVQCLQMKAIFSNAFLKYLLKHINYSVFFFLTNGPRGWT